MPAPVPVTERIILANSAALAVYERGTSAGERPTIVMAHGWPDSAAVWDLVADRLAERFHVVTYDMRGVGGSTPALVRGAYTLDKLAADLDAVITTVSPGRPVHLVGHDWGSVVGWDHVQTQTYQPHVASFTSLSGPNLDHLGWLLRQKPRRANLRPLLAQGVKSSYTAVLSLPLVRTLMWRLGAAALFRRWLRLSEGVQGYPGDRLREDAIAAVPLYRSNIAARIRRPDLRPVEPPVQLIVASRDRYVSSELVERIAEWVPVLTRREVAAGHWSPRTHPHEVARLISGFVDSLDGATTRRASA